MLFAFTMSDTVWLALIGVVTLFGKDWLDRRRAKDANDRADKIAADAAAAAKLGQENKAAIVEVHTLANHMKDDLVEAVRIASRAEGKQEERVEQHARAALLAEGAASGKAEQKDLQVAAAEGPKLPAVVSGEPTP